MRNSLLFIAALVFAYSCSEISGKETPNGDKNAAKTDAAGRQPPDELRVGRDEAMEMRGRRGKDDASIKIAAADLMALINSASPAANDSFVFFFATYNSKSDKEKKRYMRKAPGANWESVGKKPSTVLVGFLSSQMSGTMHLTHPNRIPSIPVYDLGVVCPPPPSCGCEIER